MRRERDDLRVFRRDEKPCKERRERRHDLDDERQDRQDRRHGEAELKGREQTPVIPRAPVEAVDRLKPLLTAEHRHEDEDERAREDAEGRDLGRARRLGRHPLRERVLERGDDHRTHDLLQERRKADGQRPANELGVDPDALEAKANHGLAAPVIAERTETRGQHRNVRRPCRADDPEPAAEDEDRVEHEIRAEADDHARHRLQCPALRALQGGESERQVRKEMREEDDLKILLRADIRPRGHAVGAAQHQDAVQVQVEERNQDDIEQELERDRLADELLAGHAVSRPEPDREDGGVPDADERAERRQEHHRRHRELQARHRVHAAAVADEHAVHDGIERVEGHRHERRPGISKKKTSEIPGRQLFQTRLRPRHAVQNTMATSGSAARMRAISAAGRSSSPSCRLLSPFHAERFSGNAVI